MACHRCLLPFAAPYETDQVSRTVAADALALLLTAGREDDPDTVDPTEAQWQWEVVVDALAPVEEPESHLESRFPHRAHRATQECRLAGQRAPGRWRPVHRRTHRPQRAALDPQPAAVARLHPAGLRAVARRGGPQDRLLIYTDSFRFHASVENNNVADDAAKRGRIRDDEHGIPGP